MNDVYIENFQREDCPKMGDVDIVSCLAHIPCRYKSNNIVAKKTSPCSSRNAFGYAKYNSLRETNLESKLASFTSKTELIFSLESLIDIGIGMVSWQYVS